MTVREQLVLIGLALSIAVGAAALYLYRGDAQHEAGEGGVVPVETAIPAHKAVPERASHEQQPPKAEHTPNTPPPPAAAPETSRIGVAAMGAVRREGLYYLEAGARVGDLIIAAGGITGDADLSDINLTGRLIDASTLTVPRAPVAEHNGNMLRYRSRQRDAVVNPAPYTRSGSRTQWNSTMAGPQAPAWPTSESSRNTTGLLNLNTATPEQLAGLPGIGQSLAARIVAHRQQTPFRTVDELINVNGIGEKRLETVRPLVTVK